MLLFFLYTTANVGIKACYEESWLSLGLSCFYSCPTDSKYRILYKYSFHNNQKILFFSHIHFV